MINEDGTYKSPTYKEIKDTLFFMIHGVSNEKWETSLTSKQIEKRQHQINKFIHRKLILKE